MNSECHSVCNLAVVLLALLIVILCLKCYYTQRSLKESFESPSNSDDSDAESLEHPHKKANTYDPCSPSNFRQVLYKFYKSAEQYRNTEKELHDAITLYEDKYQEFQKQQQTLDHHKNQLSMCIQK